MQSSHNQDLSKYIGFTIGVGVGIIIGLIAQKIYDKNKTKNRRDDLTKAIEKLASEVGQLHNTYSHRATLKTAEAATNSASKLDVNSDVDDDEDNDVYFDTSKEEFDSTEVNLDQRNVSADIYEHLKETEELRAGNDEDREESYELLLKLVNKNFDNCEVLWRLGRAQYDMAMLSGKQGNQDKKIQFMRKAIESCRKALEIDDKNALAHKWYGIAIGNYCEFVGSQEKIKLGYEYKQHIEKAIELNPEDPSAYSLLGRWCYEVSMLPWYLRKVATAIYGEPPSSSVDEALSFAMKAEKLKPNFWKENSLLIAKCYYQKSDYSNARDWLEKAKDLPINNEDDSVAQKEIAQLLLKV